MILFSYDIFTAQAAGGISRCMIELMRALASTTVDWQLWAGRHGNELLPAALDDPGIATRILTTGPRTAGSRLAGSLRNEPGFARAVRNLHPSVVHRTFYPMIDLLPRTGIVRVETLHDMWDERAASAGSRRSRLKSVIKHRALGRADVIICDTESTRREMIDIWPALEGRSTVIHLGVRRLSASPETGTRDRPFFLFVGRRGSYKNFTVAVEALRAPALRDHDLVCFGGGPFDRDELALISAAGLGGRVLQMGGSDDRLAGLYEAATALLYPSSYEGFGLPLLEAMIHDCPVIAAPLTSLPEVGGDAALYADPDDPHAWGDIMATLAGDRVQADALRRLGRERAAQFSWAETARKHAVLYADIAR